MSKWDFGEFLRIIGAVLGVAVIAYVVYLLVILPAPGQIINQINAAEPSILDKLSPRTAISIVLVLTGLLAWVFWLTISFGRRLSERSYLGPLTIDALARAESNRRQNDLIQRLQSGDLATEISIDDKFRATYDIPAQAKVPNLKAGVAVDESGNTLPFSQEWIYDNEDLRHLQDQIANLSAEELWMEKSKPDTTAEKVKPELIQNEILKRFENGYTREQLNIFNKKKVEIRKDAIDYAKGLLPGIDVSAFGGGWIFVLEFTTIIFIVFAALSLGFVGVLGSEQIGTILAAIAGYVLGKSTALKTAEGSEIRRTGEEPKAVLDLLAKQEEYRLKRNEAVTQLETKLVELEKELKNAKVLVPNLVGLKYEEAVEKLKEKGLVPVRKDVTISGATAGEIFDQIPSAQEEVIKGSNVTLLVAVIKEFIPATPIENPNGNDHGGET